MTIFHSMSFEIIEFLRVIIWSKCKNVYTAEWMMR